MKRYSPPKLATYTSLEMQELLASKVIYDKHDIVALWKPYGTTMFNTPGQPTGKRGKEKDEVTRKLLAIETYLPFLADKLGCTALHEVTNNTFVGCLLMLRLSRILRNLNLTSGPSTRRYHYRSSAVCKNYSHAQHTEETFCAEKGGEDLPCHNQRSAQVGH